MLPEALSIDKRKPLATANQPISQSAAPHAKGLMSLSIGPITRPVETFISRAATLHRVNHGQVEL